MKKLCLLAIIVLALVFTGCAMLEPQPSVCDKPEAENSMLCDLSMKWGLTPERMGSVLYLSSALVLSNNPDEAADALEYVNGAIDILESGNITYGAFAKYLKEKQSLFVVIAVNEFINEFFGPNLVSLPIDPFDKGLISAHLKKQSDMIQSVIMSTE